jgi:putative membrane protein
MNRNTAIALAVGAFALLALFAMPLLAFAFGFGGMGMTDGTWGWRMPMHDTGGGTGSMLVWFALVGVVSQLAFFALLAAGVYVLYRAVASDRTDPALEELRKAYARGDVDDDEYDRRRQRLEEDR